MSVLYFCIAECASTYLRAPAIMEQLNAITPYNRLSFPFQFLSKDNMRGPIQIPITIAKVLIDTFFPTIKNSNVIVAIGNVDFIACWNARGKILRPIFVKAKSAATVTHTPINVISSFLRIIRNCFL